MEDKASLARRLAALPVGQQAALRQLLKQKPQKPQAIKPRPRGAPDAPLSFGQERLWLLDQLTHGKAAYNESNLIELPFALDVDVFRRAVNEIVRRHEALRTAIRVANEELSQHVTTYLTLDIPLVDLRHLPGQERKSQALRLAAEQSSVSFDLRHAPLLRASLYRLEERNYLFALTMHHLICDGWSMGVFAVELTTLYYCFATGKDSPLPELKIQYPDFANWQREVYDEKSLAPQLLYWREQLTALPQLELPTDRARPAEFSFRGARCELKITGSLYRSLLSLCERESVTLFMLLLAALYVLLHRYTGQDDIAVGSPTANRERRELEPLIGFFVNTLVLRAKVDGESSFRSFLSRVREILLAAFAHQEVPFERVIRELQPPQDKSRNPLYQVAFQLFQRPNAPGISRDTVLPFEPLATGIAKFDLTLDLIWTDDEIKGHIDYNTDLFDDARIRRMIGHYTRLLESIVADPTRRLSELEILTADETHQLLVAWNTTDHSYDRAANIPDVFRARATSKPDHVAAEFGEDMLTYGELERRSDHVAKLLSAAGVGHGELVGLYLNRCLDLPVALLGILKAGAAYVPLDPAYPRERLTYLLADSGARTILTINRHQHELSDYDAQLIFIDGEQLADGGTPTPSRPLDAGATAYIMYTSGTTGLPKGVAVTHRNILRLVDGVGWIKLKAHDRVLHFAPLAFDASTFEIWSCLLSGATLIIAPPELMSLDELGGFIRHRKIGALFLTTSLFRQLVESNAGDLRAVKVLIFGGEAMPASLAKEAWKQLPRARLTNAYGPTECTTFASFYPITNPDAFGENLPIGRPMHNTTFYILDKYGNPVPVGVPGELYIGGDGVAQGYWRQPDLTAHSFVPDRFRGAADARLYRTGDIVAYREDGNVLFLGRRDRQIKLSGYRIELGEVETAIVAHSDVSCAAVVLDEDHTCLVAFVELSPGRQLTFSKLREFLANLIPHYMIPSQLHIVDKLFVTPNGKIDYRKLASSISTRAPTYNEDVPPRDEIERKLCDIWGELLHAERVAITDNFFELGGQSLIATRLLSRVRESFRTEVTMRDFFDNPTVAGLSAIIKAGGSG